MNRSKKSKFLPGYQDERYGVKGYLIKETAAGRALAKLRRQLERDTSKPTSPTKKSGHS